MADQAEGVITIQEAASLAGVDPMTIRRWIAAGRVKALKNQMTRRVYVKREDLQNMMAARDRLVPLAIAGAKKGKK